jgi:hypothetical protein
MTRVRCFLVREAAPDGDVGDRRPVGAQQPDRLVDAESQEEPVRREAGPRLELPAELADAQPGDRGQLGEWHRLGQPLLHHRSHRRELPVAQPARRPAVRGTRHGPAGPVTSHQLRGDHAAQLVEVRARRRLPATQRLVHRQHELFQQTVARAQFLAQFDRTVRAGGVLDHVVGEVQVHGAQGATELDGQVPARRGMNRPPRARSGYGSAAPGRAGR